MSGAPRVTIAGAGVLGLASAVTLAYAGCKVTVRDPGGPNASSVAAGMIAPVFEAVLDETARPHFGLLLAARDLWPAFAAQTGVALDRSGAMAVGEADWLRMITAGFSALNLRPVELGAPAARNLAPGLAEAFRHALLTREDWRIEAPMALAALRRAAATAGVTFRRGRVQGRGEADVLVVATGADAGLAAVAPEISRISPIKGHIVRVPGVCAGAVVRSQGVYAAPGSGRVFGATMEPGGSDETVDATRAEPLLAAGLKLFPGLAGAAVEVAAGVRAATPDGLPVVGRSQTPGVVLAVGARRNGWLLAPLVAQAVAACVTGREPGPHAARLNPARFQG